MSFRIISERLLVSLWIVEKYSPFGSFQSISHNPSENGHFNATNSSWLLNLQNITSIVLGLGIKWN